MSESQASKPLGRGLDALLGPQEGKTSDPVIPHALTLNLMTPGKYQPRSYFDQDAFRSLVASVREKGILQPILVRPVTGGPVPYEIVAGERRWRAAKEAGLTDIPVVIKKLNDRESLEVALIENIQRHDLNPLEEAEAYKKLIEEFGYTHDALAKVLSKSRSHISNVLRLLGLSDTIKKMVLTGEMTSGHARALLNARDAENLAAEVVKKKLNVRETEALAANWNTKKRNSGLDDEGRQELGSIEMRLSDALKMPVSIAFNGMSGRLTIQFKDLSQLDNLVQLIHAEA